MNKWVRAHLPLEKPIKHWLSQRCIGYQTHQGQVTHSIIEGQVLLADSTTTTAWIIQEYTLADRLNGHQGPFLPTIIQCIDINQETPL